MEQTRAYLDSDEHYWLKEGVKITTAPLDTMPPPRFYNSAVTELYLLTKSEVEKVFEFYQQYEKTENLKKNLFLRIREYANSSKSLDRTDINRLKIERQRVVNNYKKILETIGAPISELQSLPSIYAVEQTASIARRVDNLVNAQVEEVAMCSPKNDKRVKPPKKAKKEASKKS